MTTFKTMLMMASLGLVACGPSAAEQDKAAVEALLDQSSSELENYAPVPGHERLTAVVPAGGEHRFKVPLEQGGYYRVTARCGAGCNVIYLESANPAGEWDGQDITDGKVPDMFVQPKVPGEWTFKVRLIQCAQPTCTVGLRAERSTV